jgi:hypothetical protein
VEAFRVCRVAPLRQLLLSLAFLFALTLVLWIPVAGFALVWLLIPAFVVGPHAVARMAARGRRPDARLLASGFRHHFAAQLRLGAIYLAAMLLVLVATLPADGGRFAQTMLGVGHLAAEDLARADLQTAMMIGAALQTALLASLWYAPLLVAWEGQGAAKAVFFSIVATLINWRAVLTYGAGMAMLFTFVLMLALAGALLFGGSQEQQANAAMFAVFWTQLPVWFASSYLSYRDVFSAENAAAGEPPKSPTIAP